MTCPIRVRIMSPCPRLFPRCAHLLDCLQYTLRTLAAFEELLAAFEKFPSAASNHMWTDPRTLDPVLDLG